MTIRYLAASAAAVGLCALAACGSPAPAAAPRPSVAASTTPGAASTTPGAATPASIMRPQQDATTGFLSGVSCLSAKECTAVGAAPSGALAKSWNGTSWAIEPTPPTPSPGTNGDLSAVSCASATACTAVGSYYHGVTLTLAEGWNGKKWKVEHTPNPTGTTSIDLSGVSCSSATACTAVGTYTAGDRELMLAEGWNGKKWKIEPTPKPKGALGSYLSKVTCSLATACTAVGNYTNSSGASLALAEGWNGKKWAFALPPNPKGTCTGVPKPGCTVDSGFLGVSCTSVKACTAVGWYHPYKPTALYLNSTLAERWNGKNWTFESSPNPSSKGVTANYLQLNAVSCTSAKACTAVGQYVNSNDIRLPVAEGWNGTKWVIEPTPSTSTATEGSYLSSVSCKSPQCTAVGVQNDNTDNKTLAEGWNGKKWAIEP